MSMKNKNTNQRSVDWIQQIRNTVDSYPKGLVHGIQKDAIQNAWDAKDPDLDVESWQVAFELLSAGEGKDSLYLIIQDQGTVGMTGNMTTEDAKEMGNEIPESERWARWESLHFSTDSRERLGARGQGKLILLGASEDYEMFYDSLRKDGSYRVGYTKATTTEFPVKREEKNEARNYVNEELGLSPLENQGARIIIPNPREKVVNKVKSGALIKYIQETWWPIIEKYDASIEISVDGSVEGVAVPEIFPIKEEQEEDDLKVWSKENEDIELKGNQYRIKRLRAACNKEEPVAEPFQGISVFRGDMKIDSIEFINSKFKDNVYGYVEFDEALGKKMREIENTNHYEFNHYQGTWRGVKSWVEEELSIFGKEKLGLGIGKLERKREKERSKAEDAALRFVRNFTEDWDLDKNSSGPESPNTPTPPDPKIKDIRVRLSNFTFPNEEGIARVDYEDVIKNFHPIIFNNTNSEAKLTFKMFLLMGDSKILDLENKELTLCGGEERDLGSYKFEIDDDVFKNEGCYRIRLRVEGSEAHQEEHVITRRFWLGQNPPLKGLPFEPRKIPFSDALSEEDFKQWKLVPEGSGKYKLWYNVDHPAYKNNDMDTDMLIPYLSQIFTEAALLVLLKKYFTEAEEDVMDPFKSNELKGELPKFYEGVARVLSSARYNIFD